MPISAIQVPDGVRRLTARIDRLLPDDKYILQSAAVIGKDVPYAFCMPSLTVRGSTASWAQSSPGGRVPVRDKPLFPISSTPFKHALTHEVAYGSVLQERRQSFHARIVRHRGITSHRLANIERLAHHAVRGEAWDKAVTFSARPVAKAFGHSANRDAVAHYEQALRVQQQLPQSRTMDEHAIDLRFELRSALIVLGRFHTNADGATRSRNPRQNAP